MVSISRTFRFKSYTRMAKLTEIKNLLRGEREYPNGISFDDVLIVGDSFAACRVQDYDWPVIAAESLVGLKRTNKQIRGKGLTGASWWSARSFLLDELKNKVPKILICTHTEMQRIPSEHHYALNSATAFNIEHYSDATKEKNIEIVTPYDVLVAAQQYYKFLFNKEFHMWAQERWFYELDELVKAYNIPYVIHMHSFEPWDQKKFHVFKYGVTFTTALWDISDDCKVLKNTPYKKVKNLEIPDADMWSKIDTRNHFSQENNKKIADHILDALQNYGNKTLEIQL